MCLLRTAWPRRDRGTSPEGAACEARHCAQGSELNVILGEKGPVTSRLRAGSTRGLRLRHYRVFGGHRRGMDPVELYGFPRPGASRDDS